MEVAVAWLDAGLVVIITMAIAIARWQLACSQSGDKGELGDVMLRL